MSALVMPKESCYCANGTACPRGVANLLNLPFVKTSCGDLDLAGAGEGGGRPERLGLSVGAEPEEQPLLVKVCPGELEPHGPRHGSRIGQTWRSDGVVAVFGRRAYSPPLFTQCLQIFSLTRSYRDAVLVGGRDWQSGQMA